MSLVTYLKINKRPRRTIPRPKLLFGTMYQGLDSILQLISLNGYSIFSLIDDILARGECEDERIKLLQEGITRNAVDICARLLGHKPASASISAWALDVVHNNAWASIGDPESASGRVLCMCSSSSAGFVELGEKPRITSIGRQSTFSRMVFSLISSNFI